VPRAASTAVASNADRAPAYGMPGERVQDNDVEAVYDAAARAVARARRGEGPSLIEVHTVRLWGHFEGDAQGYRPDRDTIAERDPLPAYQRRLASDGVLTDSEVAVIGAQAAARVEAALDFAKSSPLPDPAQATSYVFSPDEEDA